MAHKNEHKHDQAPQEGATRRSGADPEKHFHGSPCEGCGGTLRYRSNRKCVACNRAKVRAWREADPERKSAADAAYREANREKVLARKRAYYEANREQCLARGRAWREANRDYLRDQRRAHYEVNREQIGARHREYYFVRGWKVQRLHRLARQREQLLSELQQLEREDT